MAAGHKIIVEAAVPGVNEGQRAFLRKCVRTALTAEGIDFPCEVDILVTSDEGIRELNREYRNVDAPTDVLSFPALDLRPGDLPDPMGDGDPDTGRVALGDMARFVEEDMYATAAALGSLLALAVLLYARLPAWQCALAGAASALLLRRLRAKPAL